MNVTICRGLNCLQCPIKDSACIVCEAQIEEEMNEPKKETQPSGDDTFTEDVYESEEPRQCDESCSHYDSLNQCCWIASKRGLCTDVSEGDYCRFGFKRDSYD